MENEFLTFDNLYVSALKCSNNVKWKKSTSHYLLNQLKETYKLCNDLKSGTYKERPHKQFKVYEPKERDVLSISFRDRVYQRTLNDLVIYPTMTKSFINENCACQKSKGTDFARNLIKEKLHCKNYLRYMDDLILIVKDNPEYYLEQVKEKLAKLEFKLNENKTKIVKIYKGVDFLGFTFSMNQNGKVYQCILNSNVKRRRRKINKTYIYQTIEQLENSYQTWRSYAIKTTNKAKVNKMDKFFNEIVERIKSSGYEIANKCSYNFGRVNEIG